MMKREYKQPRAVLIDYAYEEQVVAESSKIDTLGDGYQVQYCTWRSASFSSPCDVILTQSNHAADPLKCYGDQPWSLRR